MTPFFLIPDIIGTALLSAAVALAMALFAAPRIDRVIEKKFNGLPSDKPDLPPQIAFSLSRVFTLWSGMLCGLAVLWSWGWKIDFFWERYEWFEQVFVGGAAFMLLGLMNDAFALRRHQLFAGQCLAALTLISTGFVVRQITHSEWVLSLGLFGFLVTMLWLVVSMNSLMQLRKSTGLLVIDALLVTMILLIYSALQNDPSVALWCCLLGGSLAGLLVYNAPNWQTSLGATGTMFVGGQFCVLAIYAAGSGRLWIPCPSAIVISTLPLVILFIPLVKKGWSRAADLFPTRPVSMLNTSGHTLMEMDLIGQSVSSSPTSSEPDRMPGVPTTFRFDECGSLHISGVRDWAPLWETLCALGEEFGLGEIDLQIEIPSLNEKFHARVQRNDRLDPESICRMEIPLLIGERPAGRLRLAGTSRREPYSQWMQRIITGMRPFEIHLLAVLESHAHLPTQLTAPPPLELRIIASHKFELVPPSEPIDYSPIVRDDEFTEADDRHRPLHMTN
ncbi:MAG: hypothetical protein O2955_21665 [Planctomycetota bacterium]|nr:hypothetical protein [Planctomycetota bacterium]MDA1215115.1 hypothetical protein [Planctomycetota bacterium]